MAAKKEHPKEKLELHPRNRHRGRYDFKELVAACPDLAPFVLLNAYQDESIDFADPAAVKMLNTALLKRYYDIGYWEIPDGYLCPPIPGRADYIHHIAQFLSNNNYGKIPAGPQVTCLDIGVGANCIYPIIGTKEYGWSFIGTDTDPVSIANAEKIIAENPRLQGLVDCRLQARYSDIYTGVLRPGERVDLSICNPPFHASLEEAQAGTLRKLSNLNQEKASQPILNFGGQQGELWCFGGEEKFVRDMINQSPPLAASCFWFSALISKKTNLPAIYKALDKVAATEVKTIPMGQGHKTSRIVAWTFLSKDEQKEWKNKQWNAKADTKECIP